MSISWVPIIPKSLDDNGRRFKRGSKLENILLLGQVFLIWVHEIIQSPDGLWWGKCEALE